MRPPSFTKPQALSRLRALQQFQPRTLHPTITTLSCSSSPPLTSSYSSTRSFSLTPSLQKSNRATFDRVPNDAHPRRKLELVNMLTKSNWVLSPHPISPERSCISQTFCFKGFSKAFRFIRAMAKKAKDLQHHPEWSNVYNLVHVRWTTHDDPSGLTHKDFEMAWYCGVVARQLNSEGGGDKPWIRELEREEVEVLRGLVDEVAEEASKAKGLDEVKKKEEGEEEVGDTNNANGKPDVKVEDLTSASERLDAFLDYVGRTPDIYLFESEKLASEIRNELERYWKILNEDDKAILKRYHPDLVEMLSA